MAKKSQNNTELDEVQSHQKLAQSHHPEMFGGTSAGTQQIRHQMSEDKRATPLKPTDAMAMAAALHQTPPSSIAGSRSKKQTHSATRKPTMGGNGPFGMRNTGSFPSFIAANSISSKVVQQVDKFNSLKNMQLPGMLQRVPGSSNNMSSCRNLIDKEIYNTHKQKMMVHTPISDLNTLNKSFKSATKVRSSLNVLGDNQAPITANRKMRISKNNQFTDVMDILETQGSSSKGTAIHQPKIGAATKGVNINRLSAIGKQTTKRNNMPFEATGFQNYETNLQMKQQQPQHLPQQQLQVTEKTDADISIDAPGSSTGGVNKNKRFPDRKDNKLGGSKITTNTLMQRQTSNDNNTQTSRPFTKQGAQEESKLNKRKSAFGQGGALATPTGAQGTRTVGLLNTVKGNFIALVYKTTIAVEGVGSYEITVENVVNQKTLKERQIIPSLMNMANVQKIATNRFKKQIQASQKKNSTGIGSAGNHHMLAVSNVPRSRTEEGLRVLSRFFKRKMQRHFDSFKMGSIDYKRRLILKEQQDNFKKMRAFELLDSRLRQNKFVLKTKAFFRWREASKSHSQNQGSFESSQQQQLSMEKVQELLQAIEQSKTNEKSTNNNNDRDYSLIVSALANKIGKRKKNALLYLDQLVVSRMSDYFAVWKIKVLVSKGQQSSSQKTQKLDQSSIGELAGNESFLDYSVWRQYLQDEGSSKQRNQLLNSVRVRRVNSVGDSAVREETKDMGQKHQQQQHFYDESQTNDEYCLNYTFDLSLDDHMRAENDQSIDILTGDKQNEDDFNEELNETHNQYDNLLDELNELCMQGDGGAKQPQALMILQGSDDDQSLTARSDFSDQVSPFLPRRQSMVMGDGGVGGSSSSPGDDAQGSPDQLNSGPLQLSLDTSNIQLRQQPEPKQSQQE